MLSPSPQHAQSCSTPAPGLNSGQALEAPGFTSYNRGGMPEKQRVQSAAEVALLLSVLSWRSWAIQGTAPKREAEGLACGCQSQPCMEGKSSREPKVQTALK